MGGVSLAIAKALKEAGGDIFTETAVSSINVANGKAHTLTLEADGTTVSFSNLENLDF